MKRDTSTDDAGAGQGAEIRQTDPRPRSSSRSSPPDLTEKGSTAPAAASADVDAGEPNRAPLELPPAPGGPGRAVAPKIVVLGASGYGKTTLMRRGLWSAYRRGASYVLVDPLGVNSDMGRVVASARDLYAVAREARAAARPYRAVFQLASWDADVEDLWKLLWLLGPVVVGVDEVGELASSSAGDRSALVKLAGRGRNRGVGFWLTGQLPRDFHGKIKGNVDVAYLLRQPERNYAEDVAGRFLQGATDAAGRSRDWAGELQTLKRGEAIRAADGVATRIAIDLGG